MCLCKQDKSYSIQQIKDIDTIVYEVRYQSSTVHYEVIHGIVYRRYYVTLFMFTNFIGFCWESIGSV